MSCEEATAPLTSLIFFLSLTFLRIRDIDDNELVELPDLVGSGLIILQANENSLTALPDLPRMLRNLVVSGNKITTIKSLQLSAL
jgi:Leucine-rich repeat (LRR) protein